MYTNETSPKPAVEPAPAVVVDGSTVTITDFVMEEPAVADYLRSLPAQQRADHVGRAIALGLHAMATANMRAT